VAVWLLALGEASTARKKTTQKPVAFIVEDRGLARELTYMSVICPSDCWCQLAATLKPEVAALGFGTV
jgi:hypothetical protein